jgi:hypothetical protein
MREKFFCNIEGWHSIPKERYQEFSILSNDIIPCTEAYFIYDKNGGYYVVSLFDYGLENEDFILELNAELDRLKNDCTDLDSINKYLEDNAKNYDVKKTEIMYPLKYGYVKSNGKSMYINIMKIKNNNGKMYSLQIFFKHNKKMYCCGTSLTVSVLQEGRTM